MISALDPQYRPGNKWVDGQTVTTGGRTIDLKAQTCLGFARYVQYRLYGAFSVYGEARYGTGRFVRVVGAEDDVLDVTEDSVRTWILEKAEVGAHIRTSNQTRYYHSMIITSISDDGFTVIDANWSEDQDNFIRERFYTWEKFASSFASRKMQYIEVYRNDSASDNSSLYGVFSSPVSEDSGTYYGLPSSDEDAPILHGDGFH